MAKTVGIISKPRSELAVTLVPQLARWLMSRGVGLRIDSDTAEYLEHGAPRSNGEPHEAERIQGFPRELVPENTQLVIVLGGDGTLLSAARAVGGRDIPIFGVNLGNLGFLTPITVEDLYAQLERALCGDYVMSRRRMLHCELWREGACVGFWEALNDIAIAKAEIARIIDIEVHVDGHFMCVYKADGLIVSTPTGSTAYSLAAGGPIVFPTVSAVCITPICPHTLTHRPVIAPDDSVIKITQRSTNRTYLTVDGQVGELVRLNDEVVCRRSEKTVSLIHQPHMMFFDVLREKLKWGGR